MSKKVEIISYVIKLYFHSLIPNSEAVNEAEDQLDTTITEE